MDLRNKQAYRELSNQFLDQLSQLNRLIIAFDYQLGSVTNLMKEFKSASDILKEIEIDVFNQSNGYVKKQEIQMHHMDLRELRERLNRAINSYPRLKAEIMSTGISESDLNGFDWQKEVEMDKRFFETNAKLMQGKANLYEMEKMSVTMMHNVAVQNQKIEKNVREVLPQTRVDLADAERQIKEILARRKRVQCAIYTFVTFIFGVSVFSVSSHLLHMFS